MKKSKNLLYEMMVIVKPLLPDEIRKIVHESIEKLCKQSGGEIHDVDVWGKRYLAYKIKSHEEGYYLVYTLSLPAESINEFKRLMDLKQEVLRYLLLSTDEAEVKKSEITRKDMKVNI